MKQLLLLVMLLFSLGISAQKLDIDSVSGDTVHTTDYFLYKFKSMTIPQIKKMVKSYDSEKVRLSGECKEQLAKLSNYVLYYPEDFMTDGRFYTKYQWAMDDISDCQKYRDDYYPGNTYRQNARYVIYYKGKVKTKMFLQKASECCDYADYVNSNFKDALRYMKNINAEYE